MRSSNFLLISILLFAILSLNIVSASFTKGNLSHSIEKTYGQSEFLRGWINISLKNETTDSFFETNFQDSIKLIDFLELNDYDNYDCIPEDCEKGYLTKNEISSFSLNAGQNKTIGIKFTGQLDEITSISFNLQSTALKSCSNQLKINIADDQETDFSNNKSSAQECANSKTYGCFDSAKQTQEVLITQKPYCQKIPIKEAPSLNIGAWLKKNSGDMAIKIAIYDNEANKLKECTLPASSITATGSEVSCKVDSLITDEGNYYVCIFSASGAGEYKIRKTSNPETKCGFYDYPIKTEATAYQIFAVPLYFENIGNIQVSNNLQNQETFSGLAVNYLSEKYGFGIDCSDSCILPIKFSSPNNQAQQQITLSNLRALYSTDQGQEIGDKFYELEEKPVKISSGFAILNLGNANFSVPSELGNATFELSLGGNKILVEKILISKVPIINYLSPLTTSAVVPTAFTVYVASDLNISKYEWYFGDGFQENTSTNKIMHTYNETKSYEFKVKVTDIKNKSSSKIFSVVVGVPKEAANKTLLQKQDDLKNITEELKKFPAYEQQRIKEILEIDEKETEIKALIQEYSLAETDQDYIGIMQSLVGLQIPKSLYSSKTATSVIFLPKPENINIQTIADISNKEVSSSDEQDYAEGVYAWYFENINFRLSYKEISAVYDSSTEKLVNFFTLDINEKADIDYDVYLIIDYLENLSFAENYNQKESGASYYIKLSKSNKISFSTIEDIAFNELPLFISPSISKIPVSIEKPPVCNSNDVCNSAEGETWRNCYSDCKPSWLILWISLSILFATLVIYLILQEWYKRKYENYLFKNRTFLFNIIHYINNSKAKGMLDSDIRDNLKRAGWSSEQVTYAIKKYHGKRTGMFEIPIGGIIKIFSQKVKMGVPAGTGQNPIINPYPQNDINNYRNLNKGFR